MNYGYLFLATAAASLVIGCGSMEPVLIPMPSRTPIDRFAEALLAHCPSAAADDEEARDRCADGLGRDALIADMMRPSVLWGGHDSSAHDSYQPASHALTRFDSLVYCRIYLSTFMFGGSRASDTATFPAASDAAASDSPAYRVENERGFEILHVPAVFRSRLSSGSYPYPFWHSKDKWAAYQAATELAFVFERGEVVAVYRAGTRDKVETNRQATFDGQWRWVDEAGEEQPQVALFSYLLADDNPHLAVLDRTFRALEGEARRNDCLSCHAPDNPSKMRRLVLLEYPNQALAARHSLASVLDNGSMPPGKPLTVENSSALRQLADEFARLGDLALAFEAGRRNPAAPIVHTPSDGALAQPIRASSRPRSIGSAIHLRRLESAARANRRARGQRHH